MRLLGVTSAWPEHKMHTRRFRALYRYLQKNTYRCRVVMTNIVTEVFNFNIYTTNQPIAVLWLFCRQIATYVNLSTNRGTLVVYI